MTNVLGSENKFPIIRMLEDPTPPTTPASGIYYVYVDEATKTLHGIDDAGVDIDYDPSAAALDYGESGDIADLAYDDVAAAGTSPEVARADHVHGMPSAGGGGGGGGILAAVRYQPGSDGAPTYTLNSASLTDIDGTNAIVTFTVPASGVVVVELAVAAHMSGAVNGYLGIREGGSTVAGPSLSTNGAQITVIRRSWRISGLTPAASKTYKAAWAGQSISAYLGPTFGPLELTVFEAP